MYLLYKIYSLQNIYKFISNGTTLEPSAIPVKLEHSKYISQVIHTQTHALELYVFL